MYVLQKYLRQVVTRIVRDVEEQHERRRGWVRRCDHQRVLTLCVTAKVRIFPTEDTWNNYGSLLDFGSSNNLVMLGHTDTMMMMM